MKNIFYKKPKQFCHTNSLYNGSSNDVGGLALFMKHYFQIENTVKITPTYRNREALVLIEKGKN